MDADQVGRDRPPVRRDLQRLEVPVRGDVDALGQMQDQLLAAGDAGEKLFRVGRLDVGDRGEICRALAAMADC